MLDFQMGAEDQTKVFTLGQQAVYWLIHSPFLSKEIWWKDSSFLMVRSLTDWNSALSDFHLQHAALFLPSIYFPPGRY